MAFVREYFRHDIGSLMDDKLNTLVAEFGAEGYAVYFLCLEYLYRDRGEPLSERLIRRMANDLGMDSERVRSILDYAASDDCGQLLERTGLGYISRRVNSSLEERERERLQRIEDGRRGAAKRWGRELGQAEVKQ